MASAMPEPNLALVTPEAVLMASEHSKTPEIQPANVRLKV